jgi:RecB family exonuclease
VRIPTPEGHQYPTVSLNQLRTYGSGGFVLAGLEQPRGCPRKYHHRYELGEVDEAESYPLKYGSVFHKALELMEEEGLDPDAALAAAWDTSLPPEAYEEALEDMRRYLDRPSSPLDRYGTLRTEAELATELYIDDEFGPIWIRGIIDKISVDFDTANLVHVVDYKTNRHPPSVDDVRRDIQGKIYAWLVKQRYRDLGLDNEPVVVFHLDAIKWRELPPVLYSEADLEALHAWLIALVKQILRDEDHTPVINEGCAYCFVKDTCPAYQSLPDLASELIQVKPAGPRGHPPHPVPWTPEEYEIQVTAFERELQQYQDDLVAWRDKANAMRLLLEKSVKEVDSRFIEDAKTLGEVRAGGYRWEQVTKWIQTQDIRRLHLLLGEDFWDAVTTSKTRLEKLVKDWPPELAASVLACIRSEPDGTTVTKVKEDV